MENNMSIVFDAKSQNEGLARMVVANFNRAGSDC